MSTIQICVGNHIFEISGKPGPPPQNREGLEVFAIGRSGMVTSVCLQVKFVLEIRFLKFLRNLVDPLGTERV